MRICIPMILAGTLISLACAVGMIRSQPPKSKEAEANSIPLESCYATNGVNGVTLIKRGGDEPHAFDLEELIREHKAGASNVVHVRGKDLADAVKATRWTFTAGLRADTPVPPNPSDMKAAVGLPLWLVAYFGMGPSDPGFGPVHSVEVRGRSARVTYSLARPTRMTDDVVRYYLWIPLGPVEAGPYALELFDAVRNEVLLLRRVIVASH